MKPFENLGDVHVIRIPLPGYSALGTANVYVLGPSPVTLIDTGPKFPGAFEFLQEHFNRTGYRFADIEQILITHGHIDHFGLAGRIRTEAGRPIPCFIHAEDLWRVAAADTYQEEVWTGEAPKFMAMVDVPADEARKIKERFSLFRELCDPIPDANPVEDGVRFNGDGYELRVIHTPGHSPGACCFYESSRKVLFSGDHIIKHITPNPLFEIKKDLLRDPHYQSLKAYLQSLEKLSGLEVTQVLPGHGENIQDLKAITSSYVKHHRERMDRIWKALDKASRPLYQLIDEVFDFVPEGDVFLAVSEILVHLELLVEEGRAELVDSGPPAYYRAL